LAAVLPLDVWAKRNLSVATLWQYVSDHSVYIPAGDDVVQGRLYYGAKMANILRAFGLARVVPGDPFYIGEESNEKTWQMTVGPGGAVGDLRLFAEEGGESLAQDKDGNVYLAAGHILVYNSASKTIARLDMPERSIALVFGGPDRRTLYILSHTSLYAVAVRVPGV
jgi:hypothetical protein